MTGSKISWLPWGERAIKRAQRENKPIFLSIGYSTCYWCEVMDRESFQDSFVTARLNQDFICIRVDREAHPEIDEIYMAATQIYSHGGGWPNNVFLTPELKPYFCGTYFPAEEQGPEKPSFRTVADSMANAWHQRRADVGEQAAELHHVMQRYLEERGLPADNVPAVAASETPLHSMKEAFDREHGGFGRGSKFPLTAHLLYLESMRSQDPQAAEMLDVSLDHMARGGLLDQLGGGFHRYAMDRAWRVPHFEKLLADNGLLLEIYSRAYRRSNQRTNQRTNDSVLGNVVRETASFLERELLTPEGAFGSAVDAIAEGVPAESRPHHIWTLYELVDVLGEEDAAFLAPIYGFDGEPFFEGDGYVLHQPLPLAEQAERRNLSAADLWQEIVPLRQRLWEARESRPRPRRDLKVLTDWNGLAVAGLANAGTALGDSDLIQRAAGTADFLLGSLRPDNVLHHLWRDGRPSRPALIWDYVFLIRGLLSLVDAGEARFLDSAVELAAEQEERLADGQGGFFSAVERPDLVCRSREVFDSGLPSANGIAVLNLLRLADLTGEAHYRDSAAAALRAFAGAADSDSARTLCLALRTYHNP